MTLLELELRLLIARYGRAKVVTVLSRIGKTDLKEVGAAVQDYEESVSRRQSRRKYAQATTEFLQSCENATPEARRLLEILSRAYEDREFLPELRDARDFLRRHGIPATRFRSRQAAFPAILRTLSERTEAELASIDEERRDLRGPMTIISEHLLGP